MATKNKDNPMFRYLENYVGQYRVLAPYDLDTLDFPRDDENNLEESFDDLYIPCSRGEIRASYQENILVWYTGSSSQGKNVYKELKDAYPKLYLSEDNCDSSDYYIYFEAKDITKIAKIVKPRTNGAKIKPYSDKNLPKPTYKIPEKDDKVFNNIVKNLDKVEKMQFVRKCCADFDSIIQSKKGKRYNIEAERQKSRLKPKAFISYIGLWDEFIVFAKEQYKKRDK